MKKSEAKRALRETGARPKNLPAGTKLSKHFERNQGKEQLGRLYFHGGELTKAAFIRRHGEAAWNRVQAQRSKQP